MACIVAKACAAILGEMTWFLAPVADFGGFSAEMLWNGNVGLMRWINFSIEVVLRLEELWLVVILELWAVGSRAWAMVMSFQDWVG